MGQLITQDEWTALRASLKENGERFAQLVTSTADPLARATAEWSVADSAAHVTAVAALDSMVLSPGRASLPIPDLAERMRAATVDDVHGLNEVVLRAFTERDPRRLADLLRERIDELLEDSRDGDPTRTVTWLGDSRLPVAGLLAHLLNEMLLHAYDIARATRTPWPIQQVDAARFFEQFIVGLASNGVGRLLDGGDAPREQRIAVEFRSPHITPVTLVLHRGQVSVEPPGDGPDVRVSFDPVIFNLMMFGRIGKARAVLTRRVTIGGRRPWLLPVFLRTFRVPS